MNKSKKDNENSSNIAANLRRDAEERLREKADRSPQDLASLSPAEFQHTLHELRVHQIELEMQNEELQRTQFELKTAREHYFNLYDLAPVGYVTLSEKGLILEANLTAARLLGVARGTLVKQPLSLFMPKEDQDIYYLHRIQLFESGEPQGCDLRMLKKDGMPFWAHLAVAVGQDGEGAPVGRAVISDITGRKQAEEALRLSEERYRAVADYTYDWEYWQAADGSILYMSPSCERITGYRADEFVVKPGLLDEIIHPDDTSLFEQHLSRVQQNGDESKVHEAEFRILRKDGEVRWIGHVCQLIRKEDGMNLGRRVTNRDFTERKRAEEQHRLLTETQTWLLQPHDILEIYRFVANQVSRLIGDGVALTSILDESSQTLRVVAYAGLNVPFDQVIKTLRFDPTQTVYSLKDIPEDELRSFRSGKLERLEDGLHALTTRRFPQVICLTAEKLLGVNGVYTMGFVWQGLHFGGLSILARTDIAPNRDTIELIVNQAVITINRLRAEQALRESEDKFKYVFDHASVGKSLTLPTGEISVNQAMCDMLGYSQEELETRKWQEISHPEDLELTQNEINALLAGEKESARFNKRYLHKNGSVVWTDISTALRRDKDGQPLHFMTTINDITERVRAEEALRKSEARFRQMFEKHDAIMLLIEPQTGLIMDANQSAAKFYGYEKSQLLVMNINDLNTLPPEQVAEERRKALDEERNHFVFTHRLGNGTQRIVEVHSSPISFDEKKILFSVIHDITERKQVEEALRESQAKFQIAQDISPDGFTILRPERDDLGRIVDFTWVYENAAIARLNGTNPEAVVGQRLLDLFPGHRGTPLLRAYQQVAETEETCIIETDYSGESMPKPTSFRIVIVPMAGDIAILAQDITERVQAEEIQKEINLKLQLAMQSANMAWWEMDIPSGLVTFEKRKAEMLGYAPEKFHHYNDFVALLHPEDNEKAMDAMRKHIEGSLVKYEAEYRILNNSGEYKWFYDIGAIVKRESKGNPLKVTGLVMDISERKQVQHALSDQFRLLTALINSPHDTIIFSLDLDYCYTAFNDAHRAEMKKVWNVDIEKGMSLLEIMTIPELRESARRSMDRVLQGEAFVEIQHQIEKDISYEFSWNPIQSAPGEVIGVTAFIRDITHRLRNEAEIRRLNTDLEERVAERTTQLVASNKELEAFAYSVSHDLRAPLRAIDGFTKILMEDQIERLDAEGKRMLGILRANTARMDELITGLLALSRASRRELRLSRIDMATMAHSLYLEMAAPEVQEKFTFAVAPLPDAYGDSNLMRQVWSNLISNAIKYSLPKGKGIIQIAGKQENNVCTYTIQDNGVGFNPAYTHKLFGVFQRLHKEEDFEGNGVGLAIVQRTIQRMGGEVWAEGVPGQGATFSFTLKAWVGGDEENDLSHGELT